MIEVMIPKRCLIMMIGPSGSGKTTFAQRHFLPTEIVSSDFCRALIADNENDQTVTSQAFELLHHIVRKRLYNSRTTVVDATNLKQEDRKSLLDLSRRHRYIAAAFVFDLDPEICAKRNAERSERKVGSHVLQKQYVQLRKSLETLNQEGFKYTYIFKSPQDVDSIILKRNET